ncbi:hypothetical protein C7C56_017270 [Massilia glaciei]|uniref:Uncharacterized protein n=2 Tax=Massilia glaciei TaxID=1524097 RepID=A0A2U2HHU8_9BURK|nr:hypothetical protein C7C56_017270 [Massilia glaciei]
MALKSIGGYMFFFGVGSIILSFFNMQFMLLAWIDTWGVAAGWAIRIGLAVLGGAMWMFAPASDTAEG